MTRLGAAENHDPDTLQGKVIPIAAVAAAPPPPPKDPPPPSPSAGRLRRCIKTCEQALGHIKGWGKKLLDHQEDLVYRAVTAVLTAVAIAVVVHTLWDLWAPRDTFSQIAISALDGMLLAVIIMEVVRTVKLHYEGGLKVRPFLTIGMIGAVREMLCVGAHLSLQSAGHEEKPSAVHAALLELGVNGAAVVALAIALVLVVRYADGPSGAPSRRGRAGRARHAGYTSRTGGGPVATAIQPALGSRLG